MKERLLQNRLLPYLALFLVVIYSAILLCGGYHWVTYIHNSVLEDLAEYGGE